MTDRLVEIEVARFDLYQLQGSKSRYSINMSDVDFTLRCEQQIADLTLRITELKRTSPNAGSGSLLALLQETLEAWQERKKRLTASLPTRQ